MRFLPRVLFTSLLVLVTLAGCPKGDDPTIAEGIFAPLGEILPRADDAQRATFARGQAVAERRFGPEDGLGPHFNVSFCGACHERPVFGGSASRYRNFQLVGQMLPDGTRGELGVNGVLPQFELETTEAVDVAECLDARGLPTGRSGTLPGQGPVNAVAVRRPTDRAANHFAGRTPIPFFGVGLLAEIDEAAILANADPMDVDGDGISGRPNLDRGFVGRFGGKAQTVSIEGFIRGPLFNHLGITTNPLSEAAKARLPIPSQSEVRPTTRSLSADVGGVSSAQAAAPEEPNFDDDDVCDPELGEDALFDLISWAMLLAAPEPEPLTPETERGLALFRELRCNACHVEALRGPRGLIPAYTDLLVHDMGPELADGVVMGRAGRLVTDDPEGCSVESGRGCEYRTAPLWGVAAIGPYLHDGRADTIDAAIRWHGGEARAARERYEALAEADRALVVAFLESLGGRAQATPGLLPPDAPVPAPGEYAGPRTTLGGPDLERFVRGRAIFDRDFLAGEGVGPTFNGDACRSCHFDPVIGGSGPRDLDVTRHGFFDGSYRDPEMGTMAHRHTVRGTARPPHDDDANVAETRQTPALFGMGLIDLIPVAVIEANADPDDADGDGVRGRAHRLPDGRLGRFGWRADVPSTAEFVRDALSNELGLTLPPQPGLTFGFLRDDDDVPDPELDVATLEDLAFFMNMLAPPPRHHVDRDAEGAGEVLFAAVGCGSCHRALALADGTEVLLYSDVLLHDVQEEGFVAVPSGNAAMNEYRTPPLWGVRDTAPYWHDGRASTLEAAIAAHAGEADAARRAYEALSAAERAQLLAFVRSL